MFAVVFFYHLVIMLFAFVASDFVHSLLDIEVQRRCRITLLRRTPASSANLKALVAVSRGMWAVKLCTNKII